MQGAVPEDMQEFILQNFDSVRHLECLLLLRTDPETDWDAEAASRRLYIEEKESAVLLSDLSARGFLEAQKPLETYRYHPRPDLAEKAARLVTLYAQSLVEVTRLIHSKPQSRVQAFADAFRIRKKD